MDSEGFIQNIEVFPDTHYFIYRNKRYPIKFDFFKYSSKYFQKHQEEIQKSENIQLIDECTEKNFELSDDIIINFIKFVQGNQIKLTSENVVSLNYLSTKYEVSTLKKHTEDYIKQNHQKVAIDLLQKHEDDTTFDKTTCEEVIALHLDEYIHDKRLAELKIPTLYRILSKNRQKTAKSQTSKEIIEFIFIVLQKHGREASILFSEVDFGNAKIECINRLLTDFSTVFDFHFINPTLLQTLYETHSELIRREEEHRREIERMKEEIERVEKAQKEEARKLVSEVQDELLGEIRKLQSELKNMSESQQKEKVIEQERKTQIDREIKVIKEGAAELQKKKKVEEARERGRHLLHREDFNGIIKYLTDKTKGNIHDNKTIEMTASSNYSSVKNLLDFNCEKCYEAEGSNSAWICFDFKKMKIKLTGYSIQSHSSSHHLRSWKIDTSNDKKTWTKVDEHKDCPTLNGSDLTGTFDVNHNDYSRYIRLQQTDAPWGGHNLWFYYMELYGYLLE